VPERHDELEGQRKQRQPRTQTRTRSEPVHRRCACGAPTAIHAVTQTLVTMLHCDNPADHDSRRLLQHGHGLGRASLQRPAGIRKAGAYTT
jgi:hypothetical protein